MKEIKFKGKTSNGEWIIGYLFTAGNNFYISKSFTNPIRIYVIPETIAIFLAKCDNILRNNL